MLDGLSIREYRADDEAEAHRLHRVALESVGAFDGPFRGIGPDDADLLDIGGHYSGDRGFFLVAEIAGRPGLVGMGAFRRVDADTAELRRMRVEPELQGRGIGRAILDLLLAEARRRGFRGIVLETQKRLAASNALYRRAGFVPERDEFLHGFDCTWYRLAL